MKSITVALANHLATDCTTLATLWDVTRADGTVIYFTDHDKDIVFSGHTYVASTGFTPSATELKDDMSVGNLEVTSFLNVGAITETDVRAERYDNAVIQIRLVNWADTTMGDLKILKGYVGDIKMVNGVAHVSIRSLAQKLSTQLGKVYGPQCRADLGDSDCGISIAVQNATVAAAIDAHNFTLNAPLYQRALASDSGTTAAPVGWFQYGVVTFTSGANNGFLREIKASSALAGGVYTITLRDALPFPVAPGDTCTIEPGCDKTRGPNGCPKYSNIVNFRGEPDTPGTDAILYYPDAPK